MILRKLSWAAAIALVASACVEEGPDLLEPSGEPDGPAEMSSPELREQPDETTSEPGDEPAPAPPQTEPTEARSETSETTETTDEPEEPSEPPTREPALPPATTKSQLSYIFIAHPDDEAAAWSTIEQSSGNFHVFVLLTRGGHTGYCESPQAKPGLDQYDATPRDSEACKHNRITSFHRFLNRVAQHDPHLDELDADEPTLSDVDAVAGRYDVWVGANSARVIFDFPDGGLQPENLVAANGLVRALKGVVIPELPDYQAMAGSFWNASYPDCRVYEHPDHRAVHVGVWDNDLETTVQRGRTCATDPDAVYFRTVSEETWRVLSGSPDYAESGGDPGAFRESYGWLNPSWTFSEDETSLISRNQSFWQRQF